MADMALHTEQQALVAEVVRVELMEQPLVGLAVQVPAGLTAVVEERVHKLRDVLATSIMAVLVLREQSVLYGLD